MTSTPTTRESLHTIAAHILARRRFGVSGRFGLRAGPGGIATPSFGEAPETLRLSGSCLIREVGGTSTDILVNGSTLRNLATFAGVDLDEPFSCGADTPPLGPVDTGFQLSTDAMAEITDWFALAWRVLDDVIATVPDRFEVATIQLWPEHFDAATTVKLSATDPISMSAPGAPHDPVTRASGTSPSERCAAPPRYATRSIPPSPVVSSSRQGCT